MLRDIIENLTIRLEPEDLKRVQKAYSHAITYICFNEAEFAHVPPRTLGTKLAQLIIELMGDSTTDGPESMGEKALAALRSGDSRDSASGVTLGRDAKAAVRYTS